jgi:hypothetical protein
MLLSIQTLLSNIVDYAGLFPPAKLGLTEAMALYARYQKSAEHWMLGSFVLPFSQLEALVAQLPQSSREQWPLSLIMPPDWQVAIAQITAFKHERIKLVALEFPVLPASDIQQILPQIPMGIQAFFEVSLQEDPTPALSLLQGTGQFAKVRTGGITPTAFPQTESVGHFIQACAQAHVPFKATAGLHHPQPGYYPLTSAASSPTAAMQGFFNVAIAAAFVYIQSITLEETLAVLNELSIPAFQIQEKRITWGDRTLSLSDLQKARQQFFQSFGSCSFQEPIEALQQLQVL